MSENRGETYQNLLVLLEILKYKNNLYDFSDNLFDSDVNNFTTKLVSNVLSCLLLFLPILSKKKYKICVKTKCLKF